MAANLPTRRDGLEPVPRTEGRVQLQIKACSGLEGHWVHIQDVVRLVQPDWAAATTLQLLDKTHIFETGVGTFKAKYLNAVEDVGDSLYKSRHPMHVLAT
jgi:hypothetical protein